MIAIGGAHQFGHFLPVAFELQRRQSGKVRLFVCTAQEAAAAAAMAEEAGVSPLETSVMHLPAGLAMLPRAAHKGARLMAWAHRLRNADVLLCAERTSTILKRLPGACPPVLHIPHGAGDRAVGFEKRFRLFDHVMAAGQKDRDRLVESGFVRPEDCTVTGAVKIATVIAGPRRPALFDNGRSTILYNPHFSAGYSSMAAFGRRLIDAVVADGRYNLVVAPHVRLPQRWSAAQKRAWQDLAVLGRVVIDLGSERCMDMTYTLGANLYVGDCSSQVYEFLVYPRPCVFIDAHAAAWQDNQDYAMWRLGDVTPPDVDPIAAIDTAFAGHPDYVAHQRERMAYAIGGLSWQEDGSPIFAGRHPAAEAADVVERFALRVSDPS